MSKYKIILIQFNEENLLTKNHPLNIFYHQKGKIILKMPYHVDFNYTDKSIVVFGVPKEEKFGEAMGGGIWKPEAYTDKRDSKKKPAWMFQKKYQDKIKNYFKDKKDVTYSGEDSCDAKASTGENVESSKSKSKKSIEISEATKSNNSEDVINSSKIIAKAITKELVKFKEEIISEIKSNKEDEVDKELQTILNMVNGTDFLINNNLKKYKSNNFKEREFLVENLIASDDDESSNYQITSIRELISLGDNIDIRKRNENDLKNIDEYFKQIIKHGFNPNFVTSILVVWKDLPDFKIFPRIKIQTCLIEMFRFFCEYFS